MQLLEVDALISDLGGFDGGIEVGLVYLPSLLPLVVVNSSIMLEGSL